MFEDDYPDPGVAGRSARRESERRRERRLQGMPRRSGFSRLIAVLVGPSAQEKRKVAEEKHWVIGAEGEELLAKSLARRCPDAVLLHDRQMPTGRANIDHIAIVSSGVYVIDTKRYRGKVAGANPLFGSPKLTINGRDRTKLIIGLDRQVAAIRSVLGALTTDVPVHGCLCFVVPTGLLADSGIPLLGTLKINGYPLYYPRRLARRLNGNGSLTPDQIGHIRDHLAASLPPA